MFLKKQQFFLQQAVVFFLKLTLSTSLKTKHIPGICC